MAQPIVEWFEGTNDATTKVVDTVSYGTVTADEDSTIKEFYIWNNRAGSTNTVKMEDVTFTTRDRQGGLGDIPGSIVDSVKDNWFKVRVDSIGEMNYVKVGKGGVGSGNESGVKQLSTTGSTRNLKADTAVNWTSGTTLQIGAIIQPTTTNGFVYEVTTAGVTGGSEPTWLLTEGFLVDDGAVQYTAVEILRTPPLGEILGLANNTLPDGSNATLAGGNFVKISTYAEVPVTANSGQQLLSFRAYYKHL